MEIFENIKKRQSIRTFDSEELDGVTLKEIETFLIRDDKTPFGTTPYFQMLDVEDDNLKELGKLTSYGVIKGARHYLAGYCSGDDSAIMDYGYIMEKIILDLNHMDLGSCWLGLTFKSSFIAKVLQLPENKVIPAISPVGKKHPNISLTDRLVRTLAKSHKRLEHSELFFSKSNHLLTELEDIDDEVKQILEAVRLAPSASNKQPWRVVVDGNYLHLYWNKNQKYNAMIKGFNIQALDMGIAMAHIEEAAKDFNISGTFKDINPDIDTEWIYIRSWEKSL